MKIAIVVRKDLGMSCGKVAVQVGHASIIAYRLMQIIDPEKLRRWYSEGQFKVVLKVKDKDELLEIESRGRAAMKEVYRVYDFGYTQVEPHSWTAIAIGPDEDFKIDAIVGDLKLW